MHAIWVLVSFIIIVIPQVIFCYFRMHYGDFMGIVFLHQIPYPSCWAWMLYIQRHNTRDCWWKFPSFTSLTSKDDLTYLVLALFVFLSTDSRRLGLELLLSVKKLECGYPAETRHGKKVPLGQTSSSCKKACLSKRLGNGILYHLTSENLE